MPLFGRQKKTLTRLFYATDLHGSERTYRKFINAGKFYNANVLVMGGDITGKLLIPIIKEQSGHYRASLQGTTQHLETEEELKTLTDRIGLLGFYSQIMDEDEFRSLQGDPQAVDLLFHDRARQRLEAWVDLAETRLAGTGIKCYVTGGNDDDPSVLEPIYREGTQSFFGCENKCVLVDDDHTMVSVGYSTPTPWKTPREVSEEDLSRLIDEMVAQVPDMGRAIFNFHDPPNDSTLDTCPMLDWTTDPPSPILKAGQVVLHGAGSQAVRQAIEKNQPMLGLHGHIHESMAVAKIGRTTCINPGSEYGEGVLRGCLVNFSAGQIESYQMTSG
ncbi:MAG TPA: hypothetical protein VI776_04395 [Anaerolineales bacterium]|nr:hypothetical protein [Anaerolineales bacterium]